jgi:hypothetical protein
LPGSSDRSAPSSSDARSPIVSTPAAASFSALRGPTPGSLRTARGARNSASRPGSTTVTPPGLRESDAIFATTFVVATPSEHVRLVAPRTAVCTASASVRARRKSAATWPTSRYPSSSPVRSTIGTIPRTASQTARE